VIEIVLYGDDALSDEINLTIFKSVRLYIKRTKLFNTPFPILLNFLQLSVYCVSLRQTPLYKVYRNRIPIKFLNKRMQRARRVAFESVHL
jgi:hypothetical protein